MDGGAEHFGGSSRLSSRELTPPLFVLYTSRLPAFEAAGDPLMGVRWGLHRPPPMVSSAADRF